MISLGKQKFNLKYFVKIYEDKSLFLIQERVASESGLHVQQMKFIVVENPSLKI